MRFYVIVGSLRSGQSKMPAHKLNCKLTKNPKRQAERMRCSRLARPREHVARIQADRHN